MKLPTKEDELGPALSALASVLRTAMLVRGHASDSCISAAALAIDVLHHFGYPARELPVKAQVYNAAMARHVRRWHEDYRLHGAPLPSKEEADRYAAEDGAHSVGLGYAPRDVPLPANAWEGHLVAVALDGWLIDLSLDQASRPERDMKLAPVAFKVPRAFTRRHRPGANPPTAVGEVGRCLVVYLPDAGNAGYLATPPWRDRALRERNLTAALYTIAALRGGLL